MDLEMNLAKKLALQIKYHKNSNHFVAYHHKPLSYNEKPHLTIPTKHLSNLLRL